METAHNDASLTRRSHDLAGQNACEAVEARYRAVVIQMAEGVVIFESASKRIVEANPAFCQLLGYTPGELSSLTLYDVIAHDRASIDANIARIVAEGHNAIGVRQYRRHDGAIVPLEVSAVALTEAGGTLLCAVVRDVSERERAVAAVRASEVNLRAVVRNLPVIVFTLDRAGTITFADGQGLRAIHLTPEQAVGQPLLSVSQTPQVLTYVRRALAGETLAAIVQRDAHRFETHYAPLRDHTGMITGVIGVALDITRQARTEAALGCFEAGLSAREQEILALLADPHLTYAAIGARLHVRRTTVITHCKDIATNSARAPIAPRWSKQRGCEGC